MLCRRNRFLHAASRLLESNGVQVQGDELTDRMPTGWASRVPRPLVSRRFMCTTCATEPAAWLGALALTLVAACGPRGPEVERFHDRNFREVTALEFVVGHSDTTLLFPRVLAASDSFLFVFDQGDARLKAFSSTDGRQLWSVGRAGGGPAEFRNPWQLSAGRRSSAVWVVDAGLGRASLIRDSAVIQEFSLSVGGDAIARIAPLDDRMFGSLSAPGDRFFTDIGTSDGGATITGFPTPELASADPLQRQSFIATAPDGHWAVAFMFAAGFFVYREADLVCEGRTPSGVSLDRIRELPPNPRFWVGGLTFAGNALVVLGRDEETDRLDTLDFFDPEDCAYLASVRLPARATAVAGNTSSVFVTIEEPAPRILRYDLTRIGLR